MVIVSGASNMSLATAVADILAVKLIIATTWKFADQELNVEIDDAVALFAQDVVIFQSSANPANDHLMELLFIADIAKKAGARSIKAVMPYFGYARSDKVSNCTADVMQLLLKILKVAGVSKVFAVDLHSSIQGQNLPIKVENLDPISLIAEFIERFPACVIVSPDSGSRARVEKLAGLTSATFVVLNKSRTYGPSFLISDAKYQLQNENCLVIDDIIDSGYTVCSAAKLLRQNGAKSVSCFATHGVFSHGALENIKKAGFAKVCITDSVYQKQLPDTIEVISSAKIIAARLYAQ